jgi:hypothetical protein
MTVPHLVLELPIHEMDDLGKMMDKVSRTWKPFFKALVVSVGLSTTA